MLSGIANFFFGTTTEETQQDEVQEVPEKSTVPTATEEHDVSRDRDWVIVDYSGKGNRSPTSTDIKISPMENLLIEHPSMSVYKRSGSDGDNSDISESSADHSNQVVPKSRSQNVARQAPHHARTVTARAQLLAQVACVKSAQRVKRQQTSRSLGKRSLTRSNKVREVKSSGRGLNHRSRTSRPSGQMCGRIPQRKQ